MLLLLPCCLFVCCPLVLLVLHYSLVVVRCVLCVGGLVMCCFSLRVGCWPGFVVFVCCLALHSYLVLLVGCWCAFVCYALFAGVACCVLLCQLVVVCSLLSVACCSVACLLVVVACSSVSVVVCFVVCCNDC